ncbi:hypothetical protein LTR22_000808 [Elasticomyces elasticus]|nr:hypothetical protein LTR22_000808 [Elasticomyces elasticus]KAK5748256.1 hypothetical protein LTS12_021719 [Elasticomyces elasticus]
MAVKKVDIASDGDVILICSIGDSNKQVSSYRLRVSAGSLSTGSSVFKAMLGPRFKEGRQLASSVTAIEIPLPDDDPEAMIMLCRALHLQFVAMPDVLTPAALLALSVVADKYDCTGTLRFASEIWIKNAMHTTVPLDMVNLLTAAYLFQQAKVFGAVCRDALLMSEGDVKPSAGDHPTAIDLCIDHFNTVKHRIEQELVVFIENDIVTRLDSKTSGCSYSCVYKISQLSELQQRLNKALVWPVSHRLYQQTAISLERLLANLGSLDTSPGKVRPCGPKCCHRTASYLSFESTQILYNTKAREIMQSIPQVCYRCVREEGKVVSGGCSHPA